MKFKEIVSRLTGFSTPVFGVSWDPPQAHITIARRVITYLEDRRVLYNPYHLEDPWQCVQSVLDMRKYLTSELGNLAVDEGPAPHLRAMRAACRKFLDSVQEDDGGRRPHRRHWGPDGWFFNSAMGELRGGVGMHVAALAAQHGLDVEGDLAATLPAEDKQEEQKTKTAVKRKSQPL
jgi:hypothetical protein